jgi:hypothetical protein
MRPHPRAWKLPAYLTAPGPNPGQRGPAAALRALADQLQSAGFTRLYAVACVRFGVLSVSEGLTVWTNGCLLWWRADGEQIAWPAADTEGAAARLAGQARPDVAGGGR